jgi:hypothetical protein
MDVHQFRSGIERKAYSRSRGRSLTTNQQRRSGYYPIISPPYGATRNLKGPGALIRSEIDSFKKP